MQQPLGFCGATPAEQGKVTRDFSSSSPLPDATQFTFDGCYSSELSPRIAVSPQEDYNPRPCLDPESSAPIRGLFLVQKIVQN
jgi:hypothetical protein